MPYLWFKTTFCDSRGHQRHNSFKVPLFLVEHHSIIVLTSDVPCLIYLTVHSSLTMLDSQTVSAALMVAISEKIVFLRRTRRLHTCGVAGELSQDVAVPECGVKKETESVLCVFVYALSKI